MPPVSPNPSLSSNSASQNFKLWLQAKNYQPTTVKNYVADTNKYLRFVKNSNIFSPSTISAYITHLSGQNNAKRYLASLNKFCQFALDQNLTSQNIFKAAQKIQKRTSTQPTQPTQSTNIPHLLAQFKNHLIKQKRSLSTIRNYLNDLRQYITWIETQPWTSSITLTGHNSKNIKIISSPLACLLPPSNAKPPLSLHFKNSSSKKTTYLSPLPKSNPHHPPPS